jgi:hypothetical protein
MIGKCVVSFSSLYSSKTFHSLSIVLAVACCLLTVGRNVASAATLPTGFTETLVTDGLSNPTAMDFAPDGRLFVCLQIGQLRVIKNGSLLPTPFVTIDADPQGERGLLGLAFDPNFATNNFIYLYYTVPGNPPHNRVSGFTANGDLAVAGANANLESGQPERNHNGSAIHATWRQAHMSVRMQTRNAQTLSNRLTKSSLSMLTDPFPQTILFRHRHRRQSSNLGSGPAQPFTFAFCRARAIFINDVGQSAWEEIMRVAGSDYGWALAKALRPCQPNCDPRLFQYGHGSPRRPAARLSAAAFTIRQRSSFQRVMLANISSQISAPVGFACSIRPTTQQQISDPASTHQLI